MFKKINFELEKPYFDNGVCKWYVDKYFLDFINNKQDFNLPKLDNVFCFITTNLKDVYDYVVINNKQEVLFTYKYDSNGFEQLLFKLKFCKISKYYDEHENK